jgi:hypothetical protein
MEKDAEMDYFDSNARTTNEGQKRRTNAFLHRYMVWSVTPSMGNRLFAGDEF